MSEVINGDWFERLQCGECGIVFYAPQSWVEVRRDRGDHGREFRCPNGHTRVWREAEIDKIRRERDVAKQQLARVEQEAAEAARKARLEIKRMKKRAATGTCPCCQRTFSNMNTHMRKQHPDYVAGETAKIVPLKVAR